MLNPICKKLGTETAFGVLDRAGVLAANGHDIINLGIGQPDFKTPEPYCGGGHSGFAGWRAWLYPSMGLPALREAVASDI